MQVRISLNLAALIAVTIFSINAFADAPQKPEDEKLNSDVENTCGTSTHGKMISQFILEGETAQMNTNMAYTNSLKNHIPEQKAYTNCLGTMQITLLRNGDATESLLESYKERFSALQGLIKQSINSNDSKASIEKHIDIATIGIRG